MVATVPETAIDEAQPYVIEPSHFQHIVAYATLATALAYATDHWDLPRNRHVLLIIATVTAYDIGMETG